MQARPPVRIIVTEHKRCPCCGCSHRAVFPAEVSHPVQYGTKLKACRVYSCIYRLRSYDRVCEMVSDPFGHYLSRKCLQGPSERGRDSLSPAEKPPRYCCPHGPQDWTPVESRGGLSLDPLGSVSSRLPLSEHPIPSRAGTAIPDRDHPEMVKLSRVYIHAVRADGPERELSAAIRTVMLQASDDLAWLSPDGWSRITCKSTTRRCKPPPRLTSGHVAPPMRRWRGRAVQ